MNTSFLTSLFVGDCKDSFCCLCTHYKIPSKYTVSDFSSLRCDLKCLITLGLSYDS